jgi:molybdenum cofactor cytidylyltransferase
MRSENIVGIILAAGESKRFGSAKQHLPFGDTTLLGQAVRNANNSKLEQVVVVMGRMADEVRKSVDFGRSIAIDNTAYGTGCASSLLAGLDRANDCAAIMLLLGDQPGVKTEFIDQMISDWRKDKAWASVTSYQGKLGHPMVFAREAFAELRKLHGDKAVWKLIEAYPERILQVNIDVELPLDVDTPSDYNQVLSRLSL